MKLFHQLIFRNTIAIAWFVTSLAVPLSLQATTHIINFGGALGFTYSPSSLDVTVGDTIQWVGDFSFHPLVSTSVPVGAPSFSQSAGSTFSYPVTVPGNYFYQCAVHFGLGMVGSFSAIVTDVRNNQELVQPEAFKLNQNYPNPFNSTTLISFDIPFRAIVSVNVYNLIGQEVATIVNEDMAAGNYTKPWNASTMPSGVYVYQLRAGTFKETRKLILLK